MRPYALVLLCVLTSGCGTLAPPSVPTSPTPAERSERPSDREPVAPLLPIEEAIGSSEGAVDRTPGLAPGVLQSRSYYPSIDATEWHLVNGARVVLQPSPDSAGGIAIVAVAPVPSWQQAVASSSVTEARIVNELPAVRASVTARYAIMNGQTDDLRTLADEVRRITERPILDQGSQASAIIQVAEDIALSALLNGAAADSIPAQIDPADALAAYEAAFGDPGRFVYTLVGYATPEQVERDFIGPLAQIRPAPRALLAAAPDSVEQRGRPVGLVKVPRLSPLVQIVAFDMPHRPSYRTLATYHVLSRLVETALETEQSVSVRIYPDVLSGAFVIRAEGVDSKEKMVDHVAAVIDQLIQVGPSEAALASARSEAVQEHTWHLEDLLGQAAWLGLLNTLNHDPRESVRYAHYLRGIGVSQIQRLAARALDMNAALIVQSL